ncbi:MAG: hypothetical protein ACFFDI_23045 [Promethearchaeota archaeon]|jgi:hypothetical protein
MSLRPILQKFAEGFSVTGIFLQTPQEIFPIIQQKADSLLLLKRHPNLQVGITELKVDETIMGVLVESLDSETNIVIISAPKHIQEISAHWKRFLPVVKKQIQIEEFIRQESIENKLINRLEDIRLAFSKTTTNLKEKIGYDSGI